MPALSTLDSCLSRSSRCISTAQTCMICWALRMGVAQACAYRRRPSTESALDFSGFGHHFAISKRVPIIIATAMFREGKVGSTIEDALRSPRGSAGRCPWYRVHPSATIGGAVTTPSTFVGVGVGLVGDPGSQDVAHIHLQTGGARCSVCPLPKNPPSTPPVQALSKGAAHGLAYIQVLSERCRLLTRRSGRARYVLRPTTEGALSRPGAFPR